MREPSLLLYLVFGVPGVIFVLTYLYEIVTGRIKTRPESWYVLILTTALTVVAMDIGIRHVFMGGAPGNPMVLRISIGVAAIMMWVQLYLLWKHQVLPRLRKRRKARQARRLAAQRS